METKEIGWLPGRAAYRFLFCHSWRPATP